MTYLNDATDLEQAVNQAIGAASTLWDHPEAAGEFHADRANALAEELLGRIRAELNQPRLGCATTRLLLAEVAARIEVDGASGGGGLDYRTVDGRAAEPGAAVPA